MEGLLTVIFKCHTLRIQSDISNNYCKGYAYIYYIYIQGHQLIYYSTYTYICTLSLAAQTQAFATGSDHLSIWDIKDTYKVKVLSAKNVNVPENQKVCIMWLTLFICDVYIEYICA